MAFVSWKDRKAILPSIKAIYRAENADMALVRLEEFEAEWGKRYPAIGQAWRVCRHPMNIALTAYHRLASVHPIGHPCGR